MVKKVLGIIGNIITIAVLSISALTVIGMGIYGFTQNRPPSDDIIFAGIILAGLLLVPVLTPLFAFLKKNGSEKRSRILNIVKIVIIVLRVQILLLFSAIVVYLAPQTIPKIRNAYMEKFNPPVSSKVLKHIDRLIDQDSVSLAQSLVDSIPYHDRRINISRLLARTVKADFERAKFLSAQGRNSEAAYQIEWAFRYFKADSLLLGADISRYNELPLAHYMSIDELRAILNFYLDVCEKSKKQPESTKLRSLIISVLGNHPYLLLLKGDQYRSQNKYRQAYMMYRRYSAKMTLEKRDKDIPPQVKALLALPARFTRNAVLQIYTMILSTYFTSSFESGGIDGSDPVVISGRSLGRFSSDIDAASNFSWYLGNFAPLFVDRTRPDTTIEPDLRIISGVSLLLKNPQQTEFRYVNPRIISWGINTLMPQPYEKIGDVSCQTLYNRVFRDFFREKTFCYLFLSRVRNFEEEQNRYHTLSTRPGFYGVEYLDKKYGGLRMRGDENMSFFYPKTIGFWLRRGIDGSADELWQGLKRFMTLYDQDWFMNCQSSIADMAIFSGEEEYILEDEGYDDESYEE